MTQCRNPRWRAVVGALEPTEESDAVEVLATWKRTWTAMDGTGEAQSRIEDIGTSTFGQHLDCQEHPETRSREIGWWYTVLQLSGSWPFQLELPKETSPSISGGCWCASCLLRPGTDENHRGSLSSRVAIRQAGERRKVETPRVGTKGGSTRTTNQTQRFLECVTVWGVQYQTWAVRRR